MSQALAQRSEARQFFYSPVVQTSVNVSFANAPHMTWDAFVRASYNGLNTALDQQARVLLNRGNLSRGEVDALVTARNKAVLKMREPLSPFGKLYSELKKPAGSLPTTEQLLAKKGTLEGILRSTGKTQAVVNRIAFVSRVAGPALIVLQITVSAIVIAEAPAAERGRVAAGQVGLVGGAAIGGAGGAWAGCAAAAALVSPSLVVPIVGPVTTGGACVVGGLVGGGLFGWLGGRAGEAGAVAAYDFVSTFEWTTGG